MSGWLKKGLALLLCLCAIAGYACAESNEELLQEFVLNHADRNVKKIAITVDDCYKSATEWIKRDVELCKEHGITMTFFPLVYTGCLEEKYREMWQSVLDAGCEIGTHTNRHVQLGGRDNQSIYGALGRWQEALDKTLGYHYETRWLRPPYGSIEDIKSHSNGNSRVINAVKRCGYDHVVRWDISETKDLNKALDKIQNGSILLFHTKKKDTLFMEKLIPELKERGFEMVTVSELFGYELPGTSEELYVFDKEQFKDK